MIHHSDNITISIDNDYSKNHICFIGKDYYYTIGDSISKNNNEILTKSFKSPLICSCDNYLYVYSDNFLMKFDNDLLSEQYDIGREIRAFGIKNNIFCGIDKDFSPCIIELDTMKEMTISPETISFDKSYLNYSEFDNFKVISSEHDDSQYLKSCAIIYNGEIIARCKGEYGEFIIHTKGEELIVSSALNTSEPDIEKLDYSTRENLQSDIFGGYFPEIALEEKSKITFIGVSASSNPNISIEDCLADKYHQSDIVAVINSDDMKIEKRHETKKGERILYADSEKAVTYYHGKYITRSLKDWKKLNSQKASEIKKYGKYSFDACGDYVFVFDENTGKLLNKIPIK
ncbi:MAG: hypothetical protein K6G33_11110 [Ruminococcus sp.]|uniref:hypothetical protein n=1 Tax=Ruminococcus sp. TaxID=41978 RepID=UPI0025CE0403|nr:hypothetical protein [Ruminococcus sp.]MCR5601275.1 hypothetical protein [Ruminococcus sp.]